MIEPRVAAAGAAVALSVGAVGAATVWQTPPRAVIPEVRAAAEGPRRASAEPAAVEPQGEFLGVVLTRGTAELAPRLQGRLREVFVRLGDHVAAGAPIAEVEVPSLTFDLRQAEAGLQGAVVEQQRATVELAEADEKWSRRRTLFAEGLSTKEELAAADYQRRRAAAQVEAVKAQIAEQQAKVARLRQDNADRVVRAPFDGVISSRYVDPGANVTPSTPIVRLIHPSGLFTRFAVPEQRLDALAVGRPLRVWVGASRTELRGTIEKVAPEVDTASRMIVVEALLATSTAAPMMLVGEIARVSVDDARLAPPP